MQAPNLRHSFEAGEPEHFWQKVKPNLQAGRVRMLFVADVIPPELQRIVEFLNNQTDPAEVLAIEIKRYVGAGLQTLVPRIVGRTTAAQQRKNSARSAQRRWDEASFFEEIAGQCGAEMAGVARRIFDWAQQTLSSVWFGQGKLTGSFVSAHRFNEKWLSLFTTYTDGKVEISSQYLKGYSPFDHEEKRLDFLQRINLVPGTNLPRDVINRRPSIPLQLLARPEAMQQFQEAWMWAINEIRAAGGPRQDTSL